MVVEIMNYYQGCGAYNLAVMAVKLTGHLKLNN